jgi:hypothetical protein
MSELRSHFPKRISEAKSEGAPQEVGTGRRELDAEGISGLKIGTPHRERRGSPEILRRSEGAVRQPSGEEDHHIPCLFQHKDLMDSLERAEPIDQKALKNTLNHIHFIGGHIQVHLNHPKYEESILVKAFPGSCTGRELVCRWADGTLSYLHLEDYEFRHLIIDDGFSMLVVPGLLQAIDRNCLIVELPHTSYSVGERQTRRYPGNDVVVEMIQSGFQARGELLDFSPLGFRVKVRPVSSSSFRWFNSDESVFINLRSDQQIVFSGLCQCIRQQLGSIEREIVLVPRDEKVSRFSKRQIRNPRQRLVPSLTLIFTHPLSKKRVQLEVSDVSTSGFSVCEGASEGILLQGLMIPDLIVKFAGPSKMKCAAQVIYRAKENEKDVRCGLAILDMDIDTYTHLARVLASALDPHAYVSTDVDAEALWEFFFDSGFIYPGKYRSIQTHLEDFKKTYRKLYTQGPEITRHFTYQKNGKIYAHMSMVRAYEKAWLIHHHAARTMDTAGTGLIMLRHIMYYLHDIVRLPSTKTDYVFCYFRPENRLPDLAFGGFARALKNPRICSTDLFSYILFSSNSKQPRFPEGWLLQESSSRDLLDLSRFYQYQSGGLLLDMTRLGNNILENESIEELYKRVGFMRRRKQYSLLHHGRLIAVLTVNQSDLGLNMSELLNAIKILVANPRELSWDILSTAISQLASLYDIDEIPILIYPFQYVEEKGIAYEKKYQLWIFNVGQYANKYLEFMHEFMETKGVIL